MRRLRVGRVRGITPKKKARLQEIGPRADWSLSCSTSRVGDLTRIDAGGGYQDALHLVGGSAPELP
ncbi:hypothetical protein GCM10010156_24610 [Planobispora rosea]|uniref:Uncharacterized protein n=1 Tax=Planobispora rosea TaxID=35762 RepID=A0A8J3S2U3_PLARO|nr:hypothetical protein GCM10010156_24610 [Planobispora rosea]GIH84822.1 hypothetical protein Pro02_32300 [Planobispora rosea]